MACTIDFRRLDEGLGGQKNKRKRRSPSPTPMDCGGEDDNSTHQSSKRVSLPSLADPNKPSFGKPTYDGVIAGRVSGRKWKQPRTQRASAAFVMRNGKSWEERDREKNIKKAFKERKEELKEEIRKNKREKREKREEREKKKKENILRTGTKFQRISNPKTLQKIAKSKQKKLLKVVPDEVFDKSKRKTESKSK